MGINMDQIPANPNPSCQGETSKRSIMFPSLAGTYEWDRKNFAYVTHSTLVVSPYHRISTRIQHQMNLFESSIFKRLPMEQQSRVDTTPHRHSTPDSMGTIFHTRQILHPESSNQSITTATTACCTEWVYMWENNQMNCTVQVYGRRCERHMKIMCHPDKYWWFGECWQKRNTCLTEFGISMWSATLLFTIYVDLLDWLYNSQRVLEN